MLLGYPTLPGGEGGEAHDIAAARVGIDGETLRRAELVFKYGDQKLIQDLFAERTSIKYAWNRIRIKERQKEREPPPLPEGVYDIILADPPWRYVFHPSPGRRAEMHYDTMTTEAICELEIVDAFAPDAMLFLWATNPLIEDALQVVDAWGFEYRTNFAWVKDKWGTGFYVRGQHELLLISRRGEIQPPVAEDRPSSVIQAPRRGHSEKPVEIYELIEQMYPGRRYLELFARQRRPGWTAWGLEA